MANETLHDTDSAFLFSKQFPYHHSHFIHCSIHIIFLLNVHYGLTFAAIGPAHIRLFYLCSLHLFNIYILVSSYF